MLSYIQGRSANIQKENVIKDLESGKLEYVTVGEFLIDLKKEFGGDDDEIMKVVELKKVVQENRMMEEFVQEFR